MGIVQVYEQGSTGGALKMMVSQCLYKWELSESLCRGAAPNEVFYCPSARNLPIEDVLHPCKVTHSRPAVQLSQPHFPMLNQVVSVCLTRAHLQLERVLEDFAVPLKHVLPAYTSY